MSTTEQQIRALESLAVLDAKLRVLGDQLSQENGTLSALTANLKKLEQKLEIDRAAMGATERTRNELITDVRSMTQQVEHSREKLGRSRNERESNAAQRELEELRKLLRDREDEIGKLTTDLEGARQQIETTEGEAKRVSSELGASEGDIQARLRSVQEEQAKIQAEREVAMKSVPPALYRKYETIRQKRGVAIAQTTDGTCKACNMHLPPQLFHKLRREPVLEQCPSCNRIIYFVSAAAPATAEG